MPLSAVQRAEKLSLTITGQLREIQMNAYATQDRVAKDIHDAYKEQKWVIFRRPAAEIFFSAASSIVILTYSKEIGEIIGRGSSVANGLFVEPASIDVQSKQQQLQTRQSELTTWQQGWSSIMQTHETALQRLQNIESGARNAG